MPWRIALNREKEQLIRLASKSWGWDSDLALSDSEVDPMPCNASRSKGSMDSDEWTSYS